MNEYSMLNQINFPSDLKGRSLDELNLLADEIRDYLIEVVSSTGGHLGPSLGVVELTIALHYVFNTPKDHLIWDVGHQAYPHKILTGRKHQFKSLRQFKGISGFVKRGESEYDHYSVGHTSTSLSLALGDAVARDHKSDDYHIIPIIGDGAMTAGMAYEALNMIGELNKKVIIILNDNEMSISPNVGALSRYLNRIITNPTYNKMRKRWYNFLLSIPHFGKRISSVSHEMEYRMKHVFIPGMFFEELGIRYIGPVDGHNMQALVKRMEEVRDFENGGPVLIHIRTIKGFGYKHAENNAIAFHGLGPFEKESGKVIKKGNSREEVAFSKIFGNTLIELAHKDKDVVAITAAMCAGTGLSDFAREFPERFFDVGIAEQNAVTSASAMAAQGLKPYVAIYSTFLQRAYDQIIHDAANMNLPVKLIIDRGGLVGEDGPTHHGVFDISFLRPVPNMVLLSPRDGAEFIAMLEFMNSYNDGPIAIRFPRGGEQKKNLGRSMSQPIELGRAEKVYFGRDINIFSYGPFYQKALKMRDHLIREGLDTGIINLRFIKPIDREMVERTVRQSRAYISIEDHALTGGVAEAIQEALPPELKDRELMRLGYGDKFIEHGDKKLLLESIGLDESRLSLDAIEKFSQRFPKSIHGLKKVAN